MRSRYWILRYSKPGFRRNWGPYITEQVFTDEDATVSQSLRAIRRRGTDRVLGIYLGIRSILPDDRKRPAAAKVARKLHKSRVLIGRWSRRWLWRFRVEEYDRDQETVKAVALNTSISGDG